MDSVNNLPRLAPVAMACQDRTPLTDGFFAQPVEDVARHLIGALLLVDGVGGRVVETEAYHPTDPASHSFRGRGVRNAVMFGPGGRAYVYRSYGLHWCLNLVGGCDPGSAVLIRALEPLAGLDIMAARRGTADPRLLCRGPGRLCQALGVTNALNGHKMDEPPFHLMLPTESAPVTIGPRIGITKAVDTPWRFVLTGSPFVSHTRA